MSLGDLVAPAGSTLLLTTRYTAHFHQQTGMTRSAPVAAGSNQLLLTTQFQKTGARQLLPCLDEPRFKVRGSWRLCCRGMAA